MAVADLQALADLFAEAASEEGLLSTLKSIGNWDQNPGNPQETVGRPLSVSTPPANIPGNWDQVPGNWDQMPDSQPQPTLTERIAALRVSFPADEAPTYPPDYDPLCNL